MLRNAGWLLGAERARLLQTASITESSEGSLAEATATSYRRSRAVPKLALDGGLGPTLEQARHRAVLEDLADGAGDERRDRQRGELVEVMLGRHRDGVGDDDLAGAAVLQPVDRRARQDRVRRDDHDVGRAR